MKGVLESRYNRNDLVYVMCCYDAFDVHPTSSIASIVQTVGVGGGRDA